jgi:hypothetical protein
VRDVEANAYGTCSATPCLEGAGDIVVSLVVLSADRVVPAALLASVGVTVDGPRVEVRFADGERVEVTFGDRLGYARHPAGGGPAVRWPA